MSKFGIFRNIRLFQYLKIKQCSFFFLSQQNKRKKSILLSQKDFDYLLLHYQVLWYLVVLSNTLFCPCSLGQEHRKGFAKWLLNSFGLAEVAVTGTSTTIMVSMPTCLMPRNSLAFLSA